MFQAYARNVASFVKALGTYRKTYLDVHVLIKNNSTLDDPWIIWKEEIVTTEQTTLGLLFEGTGKIKKKKKRREKKYSIGEPKQGLVDLFCNKLKNKKAKIPDVTS